MTKQDYEDYVAMTIAEVLHGSGPRPVQVDWYHTYLVKAFADMFQFANSKFDVEHFKKACHRA